MYIYTDYAYIHIPIYVAVSAIQNEKKNSKCNVKAMTGF